MKKTFVWLAALCFLAAAAQAADLPQAASPLPASAPPAGTNGAPAVPPSGDNQTGIPIKEEPVAPPPVPAPPAPPPPAPAPQPAEAKRPPVFISMDFTDVDLPVLIKFISEQTRKNFIFDERVQGKITIISPRKISVEDAYNVFLSVLQVKGPRTACSPRSPRRTC
ncbi:MAG: hypothetical protein HZB63_04120 [Deltaproteobacteria bacterium]|nr:hypothetical protein [Deltaproteobacteria bacterium]